MRKLFSVMVVCFASVGFIGEASESIAQELPSKVTGSLANDTQSAKEAVNAEADSAQEAEIRKLIEQLVFSNEEASNQPIVNPNIKVGGSDGNARPIDGESDAVEMRRAKFKTCQEAFGKLYKMKGAAFPFLIEHLDDERQSINFRNHHTGNSVGSACYWNIYFQLVDQPEDYSEYGYSRKGRDGKDYPKPYWEGTPFDELGGLKKWLKKNEALNYLEMQIECVEWLLEREKKIGAADADSYFLNILPLEIRILERQIGNGGAVESELKRLIKIRDNKLIDQVPKELLPED